MKKLATTNDRISRAVCLNNKKSYCRSGSNEVKPKAFKPTSVGETSVFITTSLEEAVIWEITNKYVCEGGTTYGRADIVASQLFTEGLEIDYNNTPEYHANIVSWPSPEEKEKIHDIAQLLAANSECIKKE